MSSKIAKYLFCFLVILILLLSVYFGYFYGKTVSVKDQLPLYKSLRDLSAIIFAIMGAWIAIIFPNALANIFKTDTSRIKRSLEIQRIRLLTIPMFLSTGSIIISIGVEFFYPILKQLNFFLSISKTLRGFSYSLIAILFIIQIWCLIMALLPTQLISDDVKQKREEKKVAKIYEPNPNTD